MFSMFVQFLVSLLAKLLGTDATTEKGEISEGKADPIPDGDYDGLYGSVGRDTVRLRNRGEREEDDPVRQPGSDTGGK